MCATASPSYAPGLTEAPRRRILLCALGLLGVSVLFQPARLPGEGRPLDAVRPADAGSDRTTLYERSRRLGVLPFSGRELPAELDYMPAAVAGALRARLQSFGEIYVRNRRPLFRLQPRAGAAGDPGLGGAATSPGRVELEATYIEENRSNFRAVRLFGGARRAALLGLDIVVSGELLAVKSPGPIDPKVGRPFLVRVEVYDAVRRLSKSFEAELQERTALSSLEPTALAIVRFLSATRHMPVTFESDPADALVYAGDRYLGRTPLEAYLLPGSHRVQVAAEGFRRSERRLNVSVGQPGRLTVRLEKEAGRAALRVSSEPAGATVYLDQTRIGKTPLDRRDLPAGAHRVRIELDEHIERFVGVQLREQQPAQVHVKLEPGDTKRHFAQSNRAVLDWTYYDVHFYSLLSTLGFYAGYLYFVVQEDKVEESIRAEVPWITPLVFQLSVLNTLAANATVYEVWKLDQNRNAAARLRGQARSSATLGAVSFLSAIVFLVLELTSLPDIGEISATGDRAPVAVQPFVRSGSARGGTPFGGGTDVRTEAGLFARF